MLQSRGFQQEFVGLAASGYNVVAYRFEAQRIAAKLEFAEVCARAKKKTEISLSRACFFTGGPESIEPGRFAARINNL